MTYPALRAQLDEFRRLASDTNLHCESSVSGWCPAEHIDHCAKVMAIGLQSIRDGKPRPGGINMIGRLVLALGWIPRGRGKAPERVRGARVSVGEIEESLSTVERVAGELEDQSFADRKTPVMKHPYFGGLTAQQAVRFVVIHNRHHLKIIRDIIRNQERTR